MSAETIPGRLFHQAKLRPQAPAYHVRSGGQWTVTNYADYADQTRSCGKALMALGLDEGQTTCILGFNRPEWTVMDIATMAIGCAPAGIYTTCSPEEVAYIVGHTEAPVVLVENHSQLAKIQEEWGNLPALKYVVLMAGAEAVEDERVLTWEEFNAKGSEIEDSAFAGRLEALQQDALATFIYTSGTTGPPKGVMLSHRNLAWTAQQAIGIVAANSDDSSLSYLPLSHIAEQMFSIHVPLTAGGCIYFAESIERVPDNLREVQPTLVFGVPRIWEKMYAKIIEAGKSTQGLKRKLATWAKGVATEANAIKNSGGEPGGFLALKYKLAQRLVFSKVKPRIGLNRARVCVSGAAPINAEILEFFASLDIIIHEVYGQSEDTGPTTFNRPGSTRFGSVGPKIDGVEVEIREDGEIVVRGPNVFMGYYKDEEATNEALVDGWLHSGDLGAFDADGYLTITGRKKDIIITAGGKNVAPKNWEGEVKQHPVVGEAVMIGDKRKFLTGLISLDPEAAEDWAKEHGVAIADLDSDERLRASIQEQVDAVNSRYARVEQVKKFAILPRPLSIDDGELTPTLKVKRSKVSEHFAELIDSLYAD
jgi:long-chain acyl-CoA synthetase